MERLVTDSFRAVYNKIDPKRNKNAFEVFGYDFMIDEHFKVYMIECNTNPSLEICSPLLARIIPELLDNSFRVAIDPTYQPPAILDEKLAVIEPKARNCGVEVQQQDNNNDKLAPKDKQLKNRRKFELLSQIKYTQIFDENVDGQELQKLFNGETDQQLLKEIQEEEKECEQVAKADEKKLP